jgi:pyruvate dehydrogenase E2 component (dihydrolipoamide acetyltransferase)
MAIDFKLPEVGENIDQADVGSVLVKEGDVITSGQIVAEIETDKAVFELPCPHAGKVTKVHVKTGEKVKVGATLLSIEAAAGKPAEAPKPTAAPAPAAPAPAAQKPAAAPTPAAATTTVAAPPRPAAPASASSAPAANGTNGEQIPPAPAGPSTRRLARELGVDLHRVKGTGPGGRITPEDVQAFVRSLIGGGGPASSAGGITVPPLPDFSQFGPIERQPLNKLRRVSATNLSLAWNVIPHVTQHDLVDVTDLEAMRKRYIQAHSSGAGSPKITMTVLAMKALVTALKSFPMFNSSYDSATGEAILKHYYNLGIAVDTEQGLLVPVVRDVDKKSVLELAAELTQLAEKARARKLGVAEMQGGTFTITNLGGIGGTYFTPIVNYPEVAILGMSRSSQQQVVVDGTAQIRLMLPLSLSYDHRVINGADAARFIVKLSGLLSDPFQLLSEV